METNAINGAASARYTPTASPYAANADEKRAVPVQPERRAEDPFAAANGTLHFSSQRKRTSETAHAQSAAPRAASGGGRSAGSAGAKRTGTSSGGSQPPKKRRRKKKNKRLILFAFGFLLFAVIVLVGTVLLLNYFACGGRERCQSESGGETAAPTFDPDATPAPAGEDTVITADATVEGVSVWNLTLKEARSRVAQKLNEQKASVQITVSYEQYETTLSADDLGLTYEEALDDALERAAKGAGTLTLSVPLSFDPEQLRTSLYSLNEQIPNHATNATAELTYESYKIDGETYYKPKWVFHEGTNGAQLDYDSVEREVKAALEQKNFSAVLTPAVSVSEPDRTADDLRSEITLLGSYTTNYRFKGSSSTDAATAENAMARDRNITKAIGMMQFIELKPGKTFSFNDKTGERSEKKGWALANAVYMGQGYRKEPGGGVCQVSTTMFNALLRAGVHTFSRRGHSIPSDYVTKSFEDGLGYDATVDYGHIDFKFTNDTGNTLYVLCYITKNKDSGRRKNINVEVYGREQPGVEYRCRNEILEKIPATEDKAEYQVDKTMLASAKPVQIRKAHDGYKVTTYVDMYRNGSFVRCNYTETTVYEVIYPKYIIGSAVITPAPTATPKATDTPAPEGGGEEP